MAEEELLERLRAIARSERRSLASVIREGLELRARRGARRPSFIGAVEAPGGPHDTAERAGEAPYEPLTWR
jgi:hypothetical protein